MAKVRQDAWSHEDDLLLAETVLRHIREGSTQLNAFEEVGDHLNRTSAACGFRWNAEIRKKYVDAIELAKRQRKEKKRALQRKQIDAKQAHFSLPPVPSTPHVVSDDGQVEEQVNEESSIISFDTVISFLNELKKEHTFSSREKLESKNLKQENEKLRNEVKELHKQLNSTEKQLASIKEDYQTFIQIMDRARKMTIFNEEDALKSPSFRMDKNGNLEQLAQSSGN